MLIHFAELAANISWKALPNNYKKAVLSSQNISFL